MRKTYLYILHAFIIALFLVLIFWGAASNATFFKEPYAQNLLDAAFFYGSMLGYIYLAYGLFIPKFLIKKQPWNFVFGLLGLAVGYGIYYYLTASLLVRVFSFNFHFMAVQAWMSMGFFGIFLGMAGTFFRLFIEWLKDSYDKTELEKQNFKSELSLLKNQLNPHFLFNTLNNIDSLILENSPNASPALNKLSELMRYMVYGTDKECVPLDEELSYLQNYIALQKLRLPNEGIIRFAVHGDSAGKQIAPMLFMPFIENAFKHSSLKDKPENCIDIRIAISDNGLSFYCLNAIAEIKKDSSSGVGMAIVRKRLALIYPGRYQLNIEKQNGNYIVHLDINL